MKAEDWNRLHRVGVAVRYWPWLPPRPGIEPITTYTLSEAYEVAGNALVKVNGRAGGVSVDHLEVLPAIANDRPARSRVAALLRGPAEDPWLIQPPLPLE